MHVTSAVRGLQQRRDDGARGDVDAAAAPACDGQRDRLVVAHDRAGRRRRARGPGTPTAPKPACQPQRSAMTPPSTTPSTEPRMPGREECAEHRAAHAHGKQRREQRGADGAVGGFAEADDAARGEQLRVASRERAGDRREAPDQRHQEDALDAAPPIGEQRQRHGAERDGDRDDRDEARRAGRRTGSTPP